MSKWYRVSHEVRAVDPDDRGFQYGDGLFETIAIRDGKPRLWDFHLARLNKGCKRLGLNLSSASTLQLHVDIALRQSPEDTESCIAKIIVTAGTQQRGYARSMKSPTEVFISIFPATPVNKPAYMKGIATMMCDTRLAVGSPVAGLKTLNRIEQVLGRSEVAPTGAFEGLMRDAEDRLICGTMSNVFIVNDKLVKTPSVERCGVAGTMRRLVIQELERSDSGLEICDLTEDDLANADEVFIANSQMGVVPVHRCGDLHWQVGAVTRDVMHLLAERGIDECRV